MTNKPPAVSKSSTHSRLSALIVALWLGGCATQPLVDEEIVEPAPVQLPPSQVYFYPASGQTSELQERDRYECYLWAVKQTGYDPSQPPQLERKRVEVLSVAPAGQDTVLGAFSGAMLGAAVSRPRDSGEGALVGAILGAMIGAASDSARQDQTQVIQQRYDRRTLQSQGQIERRANDYRRAMAACLEGRGYTVH